MATHEIARSEWATFFKEFSQRHDGSQVEIEAVSPTGIKQEIRLLPFAEISYDETGSGAGKIHITANTEFDGTFTHSVSSPKQVYHKGGAGVLSDEVTTHEILEITSEETPPITYLRFYRPGDIKPQSDTETQTAI